MLECRPEPLRQILGRNVHRHQAPVFAFVLNEMIFASFSGGAFRYVDPVRFQFDGLDGKIKAKVFLELPGQTLLIPQAVRLYVVEGGPVAMDQFDVFYEGIER